MKLTLCACCTRTFIDKDNVAKVAAAASVSGWDVEIVDDLCAIAQNKDAKMGDIAQGAVVACHERAVKSLIEYCGADAGTLLNIRSNDALSVLAALGIDTDKVDAEALAQKTEEYRQLIASMPSHPGDDAWYPTIDKDVCAECGKCLDFCPFGVYEMVDDRVRVVHPQNCKNNCPACARTCPASAVIFPKYTNSPINGGVEKQENAIQIDTKTLFSAAFKERLEARRLKR